MRRQWTTLTLLTAACVAFAVMQTLVIPALPFFRREFGTSQADTTWLVTGFLLSSSVLTPLLGKLGDMYGKKRLLVAALAVFGGGSLAAALGDSLAWLVACRVVQGAGAAVFPLSFGIIRDEFPRERVGIAIGLVSSAFGMGGGIGLVGSGFVLDQLSWPWLFLLGGAPVLVAAGLIAALVPESPVRGGGRPDFLGAGVFSAALVALLLAITKGETWGWASLRTLTLFGASAGAFLAWVRVERRVAEPLVDLRTLARPAMAVERRRRPAGCARRSAPLERADEQTAGERLLRDRRAHVVRLGAALQAERGAQRVELELVVVGLVALRRARAAVAVVAERVLALLRAGRGRAGLDAAGRRGDAVDGPVGVRAAGGVRVVDHQRERLRALRHVGPRERR
jgi:MFS family permease